MPLTSSEIKAFVEVTRTKNISRAAERLGTSQPRLSMMMKRLEIYFGAPLFVRTKHGVELTKSAVKLATQAQDLLRGLETLRESVSRQTVELEGVYSVGCHPQVAAYSFPKFARALLSDHHGIELRLVEGNSREILSAVVAYEIDFGIVVNPTANPDLVIVPLYPDKIQFWTRDRPSVLQNPLSENSVVFCDRNLLQMESLLRRAQKSASLASKRIVSVSDLDVIRTCVAEGVGIGILPTTVGKQGPRRLVPFKQLPTFDDRICLVYRADCQKTQAAKLIKDYITTGLKSREGI